MNMSIETLKNILQERYDSFLNFLNIRLSCFRIHIMEQIEFKKSTGELKEAVLFMAAILNKHQVSFFREYKQKNRSFFRKL